MARRVVTVFGGSGFIGRHLVRRLAASGAVVRAAVRDTQAALYLKTMGEVGQIVPFGCDITDPALTAAAVEDAEAVVNLVGILSQWGRRTFQRLHVDGAANVAAAAKAAGARRLVQVSALGADAASASLYGRTKAAGEEAVLAAFPDATIVRPSVVFGPEDKFFNLFAAMAGLTPVLPVFGCPLLPKVTLSGDAPRCASTSTAPAARAFSRSTSATWPTPSWRPSSTPRRRARRTNSAGPRSTASRKSWS